jgi:hypothetical protein
VQWNTPLQRIHTGTLWAEGRRHRGQAPEIDGVVYLSGGEALPGQMMLADIEKSTDYDLVGDLSHSERSSDLAIPNTPLPGLAVHRDSDGRRVRLRTFT